MSDKPVRTDPRPLYVQVRETLKERIRSGAWKPGQLLANEFELGRELGVSQGTARKALDSLAAEQLVVRRQGRGTFVVEHTPAHVMFRFFNLFDDDGAQILPDSRTESLVERKVTPRERKALALSASARVVRIERMRTRLGQPFIVETIAVPAALFPGLGRLAEVPNTLYDLFQKSYGVLVARADERVTAVTAAAREARLLGVRAGAPLLRIERIAFGLDERPIELRVSLCHLERAHYLARLR